MTGVGQGLYYIEREIRFMVKDPYGSSNYSKYADRVVADCCGIDNFCTRVISSRKPLSAIYSVVNSYRGDALIKFFNAALHDTRIDMVTVLAEAIKLKKNGKNSKKAYNYLMRLYKKAVKRMHKLISGTKSEDAYKSLYKGLRKFAYMDDDIVDIDMDDEDECDEKYIDDCERSDSVDVLAGLHAETESSENNIVAYVRGLEQKLGRRLTNNEISNLIGQIDDDDEDEFSDDNDDMIEKIAEDVYTRLISKMSTTANDSPNHLETLDEFRYRMQQSASTNVPNTDDGDDEDDESLYPNIVEIPESRVSKSSPKVSTADASLKELVDMHNHVDDTNNADCQILVDTDSSNDELSEDNDDTDGNGILPPNESLGGNDNNNEKDDIAPQLQHLSLINDILSRYDPEAHSVLAGKIKEYFTEVGVDTTDVQVYFSPSMSEDYLVCLNVCARYSGNHELINDMKLPLVTNAHLFVLDGKMVVPVSLIDRNISVVNTIDTIDYDLQTVSTNTDSILHLYTSITAICVYIYKRLGIMIDIRFIRHPETNKISIYFSQKNGKYLNNEFSDFYKTELIGHNILQEVFEDIDNIDFHIISSSTDEDNFRHYANEITQIPLAKLGERFFDMIKHDIETCISDEISITSTVDLIGPDVDGMYTTKCVIISNEEVDNDEIMDVKFYLPQNGEYTVQSNTILHSITHNTGMTGQIIFTVSNDNSVNSNLNADEISNN